MCQCESWMPVTQHHTDTSEHSGFFSSHRSSIWFLFPNRHVNGLKITSAKCLSAHIKDNSVTAVTSSLCIVEHYWPLYINMELWSSHFYLMNTTSPVQNVDEKA